MSKMKEVQLSARISSGHIDMKVKNALRLLEARHPTRLALRVKRFDSWDDAHATLNAVRDRIIEHGYGSATEIKRDGQKLSCLIEATKKA